MSRLHLLFIFSAFSAASAQSIAVISGQGQIFPQHFRFEPLVIQLRTAAGAPAANTPVEWRVAGGNADARLQNFETSTETVTDSNGFTQMTVFQNPFPVFGRSFAQGTITATALNATATFTLTTIFTDRQSGAEQVYPYLISDPEPVSGPAGSVFPPPIVLHVVGFLGGGVPGVAVEVLQEDPWAGATLGCVETPGQQPGMVLTDADGIATCNLRLGGSAGSGRFQLRIGGTWRLLPGTTLPYTVTAPALHTISVISGDHQSAPPGNPLPLALTAQVKDPAGNAAQNAAVVWDVPLGSGFLSATSSTADILGRVWTNFTPANAGGNAQIRVRLASNPEVQAVFSATGTPRPDPSCSVTVSPQSFAVPLGGTTGAITVTPAGFGCAWSATTTEPWIQFTGLTSATSTAAVTFSVTPNTGRARGGNIRIANRTVAVSQSGSAESGCNFALSQNDLTVPANDQNGTLELSTTGTCEWTASSDAAWFQISPSRGAGPFQIQYTVLRNLDRNDRKAIVTIAGTTVSVMQNGASGPDPNRLVGELYFHSFGRAPSVAETANYVQALGAGLSRAELVEQFLSSGEFNEAGRFAAGLRTGLLNRDPLYSDWVLARNSLSTGALKAADAAADVLNSPEYEQLFGKPSDEQFLVLLYRYGLQRAPAAPEAEYHTGALEAGLKRAQVAAYLLNTREFQLTPGPRLTAFLLYATILRRDPTPSEHDSLSARLQAGASVQEAAESLLASPEFEGLLR